MDRQRLATALGREFEGSTAVVRAVSRQACDLADLGSIQRDGGYELSAETVISHLQDAPEGYTLKERWNWWIGSLELAYGAAYRQFRIRDDIE